MTLPAIVRPPRRYRRLIERVCDRDREWFERHPKETNRVRAYVPGELYPVHAVAATHVEVRVLPDGTRARSTGVLDGDGAFRLTGSLVVADGTATPMPPVPGATLVGVIDCREARGGRR